MVLLAVTLAGCARDQQATRSERRPQEPVPPLPYATKDVQFINQRVGNVLAGTLTLPDSRGPHPAVCLISGSGPQDRDETVADHKPFLIMADYLTRQGLAVLRYDDRGVGQSTGNFAAATMKDFASDAQAAVQYLRTLPMIDEDRIALIGHSEGGLVAPLVSLSLPDQVACMVLLASPGVNGEQILYLQDAAMARARGEDEEAIARSRERKRIMFDVIKQESDPLKAAAAIRQALNESLLTEAELAELKQSGLQLEDLVNQQIRLLNNDATRFFLVYDPIPTLKRIHVPVLALFGEKDLQVPSQSNAEMVASALATGDCPDHLVRTLDGLNHLFQTAETGLPENYQSIRETMAPMALRQIADWLRERLIAAE